MVRETDTIVCAAMTEVSDAGTMRFFINTMVPIPETVVITKETIFSIIETIIPVAGTLVSGLDTMDFISHPMVSVSETMV